MLVRRNINLELENLRKFVSTPTDDTNKVLLKRTGRIHASYLFHPFGQKVLQDICSTISSTGPNNFINGWKDLAGYLGLTFHQICCIQNYNYIDNTEMVLMAYAQGENSSLGEILRILLHIKRPDAVTKAYSSINEMVDSVLMLHHQAGSDIDDDSDIISNSYGVSKGLDFLFRPNNFSKLKQQLPITLRELTCAELPTPAVVKSSKPIIYSSIQSVALCQMSVQNAQPCDYSANHTNTNVTHKHYQKKMKTVLLTFADDGKETALRVAKQLREDRESSFPIGVIILDEQEKFVCPNAEQFIMRCFAQTDYVMPIVTKGYLKTINFRSSVLSQSALSSLDSRYVNFIHDLMVKYYIDNQCRNSKIRCILPSTRTSFIEGSIMRNDPTLRIWIHENEVDSFVSRISLKKK